MKTSPWKGQKRGQPSWRGPTSAARFGPAPFHLATLALLSIVLLALAASAAGQGSVMVVALDGAITPASDEIVREAIADRKSVV